MIDNVKREKKKNTRAERQEKRLVFPMKKSTLSQPLFLLCVR